MRNIVEELERALSVKRSIPALYERWWGGCDRDPDPEQHSIEPLYHERFSGQIVNRFADGSITLSTGAEIVSVRAGGWLAEGNNRAQIRRRRRWTEPSFEWRLSARAQPASADAWMTRVYLPAAVNHSSQSARLEHDLVADALDEAGLWFESKVRRSSTPRSDHMVIWVASRDAARAAVVVASAGLAQRGMRPPPLTLDKHDFALAADLPGGQSRGIVMCNAMLAVGDLDAEIPILERWNAVCESFGLVPQAPWRHGYLDPFRSWKQLESDD